jgi:hypothetical protein
MIFAKLEEKIHDHWNLLENTRGECMQARPDWRIQQYWKKCRNVAKYVKVEHKPLLSHQIFVGLPLQNRHEGHQVFANPQINEPWNNHADHHRQKSQHPFSGQAAGMLRNP